MNPIFLLLNIANSSSFIVDIYLLSIITSPDVGLSSAPSICRSVLLPDPDFPTIATNSPWNMLILVLSMALTIFSPSP